MTFFRAFSLSLLGLCFFQFGKAQDTDPPVINVLNPANMATNLVPLANVFTITFNEQVRQRECKLVNIVRTSDGEVIAQISTFNTGLTTSHSFFFGGIILETSSSYHITIESGSFEDAAGNSFGGITNSDTWSFMTGVSESDEPLVNSFFPGHQSTNVSNTRSSFTINFNELVREVPGKNIRLHRGSDDLVIGEYTTSITSF